VFGIDHVSSECMSLTLRYLTWPVDGLVGLCCSQVGVVPSVIPANFYPLSGRNHNCGVELTYASTWGMTHQQSCDLGTMRREIPTAELGL